jgi:hypothetical protein
MNDEHISYRLQKAKESLQAAQKGDYGDMFDFKEEDVVPLFDPVHRFVTTVEQIIQLGEEEI